MVDAAVDAMDLTATECGFWWYQVSKLEHQLINLRHAAASRGATRRPPAHRERRARQVGRRAARPGARERCRSDTALAERLHRRADAESVAGVGRGVHGVARAVPGEDRRRRAEGPLARARGAAPRGPRARHGVRAGPGGGVGPLRPRVPADALSAPLGDSRREWTRTCRFTLRRAVRPQGAGGRAAVALPVFPRAQQPRHVAPRDSRAAPGGRRSLGAALRAAARDDDPAHPLAAPSRARSHGPGRARAGRAGRRASAG